eukprot:GDKI01041162.1.p1 GENE.GDKI01041162.1~~GDKI01041162.1.p1  ORF type:complete len:290 (+),score=90.00 GDKI01041162.1:111-980(+)
MSTTNPKVTTTEFEDQLIKRGIMEAPKKEVTEEQLTKWAVDEAEKFNPLEHQTLDELNKLEDDVEEDVLEKYRKMRLEQMRKKQQQYRFGELYHLYQDEFVKEVTEASKIDPETREKSGDAVSDDEDAPKRDTGTWVVVHLYQDSVEECVLLNSALMKIAKKFGNVKFMKGKANEIIPNFPDKNCPALLLYRGGMCRKQIIGGSEYGGVRMTTDSIEWVLAEYGVIKTELQGDPRIKFQISTFGRAGRATYNNVYGRAGGQKRDSDSEESEESDRDDRGYTSTALGRLY